MLNFAFCVVIWKAKSGYAVCPQ